MLRNELPVLIQRCGPRVKDLRCESHAAQKKRGPKPRVLYLLNRWLFQLFPSIVDVHGAFVDVQHSGYTSRVVGNP